MFLVTSVISVVVVHMTCAYDLIYVHERAQVYYARDLAMAIIQPTGT